MPSLCNLDFYKNVSSTTLHGQLLTLVFGPEGNVNIETKKKIQSSGQSLSESFLVMRGTKSSSEKQNAPSASQKDAAPRRNDKAEIRVLKSPHNPPGMSVPPGMGGQVSARNPSQRENEAVASCHSTKPELMISSHFFS